MMSGADILYWLDDIWYDVTHLSTADIPSLIFRLLLRISRSSIAGSNSLQKKIEKLSREQLEHCQLNFRNFYCPWTIECLARIKVFKKRIILFMETLMLKWSIRIFVLFLATQSYGQVIVPSDTKEGRDLLEVFANIQDQEAQQNSRFASVPALPSAINSAHGNVFLSMTYANPRGGVVGAGGDGDAAIGFSVGDADDSVSFQFTANITGIDPFANDGYLSVQASSAINIFTSPTYVGLTIANLAGWGDAVENDETASIQMTQNIIGNTPIQWTVGLGTGVRDDQATVNQFGGFAGVGFGIADGLSVGASTNFDKFNVGATYMVSQVPGLSLSITGTDITGRRGEAIMSLSVGYSFPAF